MTIDYFKIRSGAISWPQFLVDLVVGLWLGRSDAEAIQFARGETGRRPLPGISSRLSSISVESSTDEAAWGLAERAASGRGGWVVNGRPRVLATAPLLVVSDLQCALDFYLGKLGFVEPTVHGDPPCFAMLNRDGFDLMLSLAEGPGGPRPHGPSGAWDVYARVADVGAEAAALAASGVAIDRRPTDTFYEMREIEVLDPDGHRWCFGQEIGGAGG